MPEPVLERPRRRTGAGLVLTLVLLGAGAPAGAASDLLAFTREAARRQGAFEVAGVSWTCGGELCSAKGPDDAALWPGLCAAFVREAGAVVAFGTPKHRFDAAAVAACNETGAAAAIPPSAPARLAADPPAPARAPDPPAAPPAAPAPPALGGGDEPCNGRDDDGDGSVDEGVRLRVWEDRDHDLFGDPARTREICPHELAPGLVVNDYDCDDTDPKRNPARGDCG
jgi:hypothetical protein